MNKSTPDEPREMTEVHWLASAMSQPRVDGCTFRYDYKTEQILMRFTKGRKTPDTPQSAPADDGRIPGCSCKIHISGPDRLAVTVPDLDCPIPGHAEPDALQSQGEDLVRRVNEIYDEGMWGRNYEHPTFGHLLVATLNLEGLLAERDKLVERVSVLERVLLNLVRDVQDYEAWERPCLALDEAKATLTQHGTQDQQAQDGMKHEKGKE